MSYLPNSIFVPDAKLAGKMRKKIKHHRVRTVRRREGERREVSRSVLLAAKALKIPLERVAPVDIEVVRLAGSMCWRRGRHLPHFRKAGRRGLRNLQPASTL